MFGKTKLRSLEPAEDLVSRYDKFVSTIDKHVTELTPLIERRYEAEAKLETLEVEAALAGGEPASSIVKTHRTIADTRAELDKAGAKLAALRTARNALAVEIAQRHGELLAELPVHHQTLKEDFAREWEAACKAFAPVLGKRRALEQMLGEPLTLPQPEAAAFELSDAARPRKALDKLAEGLKTIARALSAADDPARHVTPTGTLPADYDPTAIYRLTADYRGLAAGTLVIDASFDPGRLRGAVERGKARTAREYDARRATFQAKRLQRQVESSTIDPAVQLRAAESEQAAAERRAALPHDPLATWDDSMAAAPKHNSLDPRGRQRVAGVSKDLAEYEAGREKVAAL